LVSKSKELRVQFDRGQKVIAKLLVEDADKDLAVLHANLAPCPSCKSLILAEPNPEAKMSASVGTRLFAITSPIGAEKALTGSTITKVDEKSTLIDTAIQVNDSGAPLFNSKGEVIGLLRFVDQKTKPEASKKTVAQRIETSGVIAIDEARDLLAKARQLAKEVAASPSAELLPTEPDDSFPTDTLINRVDIKKFKPKSYEMEVGKYQLTMITPPLKYYIMERYRIEFERQREKEAKKNKSSKPDQPPAAAYSFRNFSNWADYVSQMRPVVHLLAMPEVRATGKSMFLSFLSLAVSRTMMPLDYKFRSDFKEMLLTCDGKPVIPIQRGRIEFVSGLQSYYKIKNRNAYAGFYTYPIETFDPERCKQLSLQVASEESSVTVENKLIDQKLVQQVWTDFEPYRQKSTNRK
jgi:hypothetical protein